MLQVLRREEYNGLSVAYSTKPVALAGHTVLAHTALARHHCAAHNPASSRHDLLLAKREGGHRTKTLLRHEREGGVVVVVAVEGE